MNVDELKIEINQHGVVDEAFALNAKKEEAYCLQTTRGGYKVFYCERGNENDCVNFTEFDEAARYLKGLLFNDPTTRIPNSTS